MLSKRGKVSLVVSRGASTNRGSVVIRYPLRTRYSRLGGRATSRTPRRCDAPGPGSCYAQPANRGGSEREASSGSVTSLFSRDFGEQFLDRL